jgi:hypothetical protein
VEQEGDTVLIFGEYFGKEKIIREATQNFFIASENIARSLDILHQRSKQILEI